MVLKHLLQNKVVRGNIHAKRSHCYDSIACLAKKPVDEYKIGIVPIRLLVQGKAYRDLVDMTPSDAYKTVLAGP